MGIPGHPQFPVYDQCYIIPYWKEVACVEVVSVDSAQIPGTWHIYPAQEAVPIGDSADRVPPDSTIYNSDSLYPGKVKDDPFHAAFDGARVVLYGCGYYNIQTTNSQGRAYFTVTAQPPGGTIITTASKHNYKPAQTNIYAAKAGLASDINLPTEFFLSLASSNPVKGDLKLQYGIPFEDEGFVSLKIYDVSGRCVQTVFSEQKAVGYYDLSIPVSSLPAGTYFMRLEAGAKAVTKKIIKGGE